MIDRQHFYINIRAQGLFNKLSNEQVAGMEAIFNEWELWVNNKWVDDDLRKLAYMLATAKHETANTMQAIEEYGKGKGHKYGKIDPVTGKAYYGRGLVQLTWDYNYKKMGKLLNKDLYNNPDLALDLKTAVEIMFEGMLTGKSFAGDFTGKSLINYFNKTTNDPYNARKIINGLDKAKLIQSYHEKFLASLS